MTSHMPESVFSDFYNETIRIFMKTWFLRSSVCVCLDIWPNCPHLFCDNLSLHTSALMIPFSFCSINKRLVLQNLKPAKGQKFWSRWGISGLNGLSTFKCYYLWSSMSVPLCGIWWNLWARLVEGENTLFQCKFGMPGSALLAENFLGN